jgi:hypothetical protein
MLKIILPPFSPPEAIGWMPEAGGSLHGKSTRKRV